MRASPYPASPETKRKARPTMDDDLPLRKTELLARLKAEDLTPLSVSELQGRIADLEAEIARTQAHLAKADTLSADAEALFRKR
jgi:uncharacterized small protein (DUF1192 family)